MAAATTEGLHPDALGLDRRPLKEIAAILHSGQVAALSSVGAACDQIAEAAVMMADTIRSGGRLVYVAAGSSGLMALADAAELGATYGIPAQQIVVHMAGGVPTGAQMPGATEDDVAAARTAGDALQADDLVIAVSASGTTPFPMELVAQAWARGVRTIALANNADVPMFAQADVAIALLTPPEVIAGSTRLGAGTAQKVALNMMSTLMGIVLGHVYDGRMVNLVADNAKLRQRAIEMVADIAGVPLDKAQACLAAANGAVKPAALLAAGAGSLEHAEDLLVQSKDHLRAALALV